jgi:hypothetical protein
MCCWLTEWHGQSPDTPPLRGRTPSDDLPEVDGSVRGVERIFVRFLAGFEAGLLGFCNEGIGACGVGFRQFETDRVAGRRQELLVMGVLECLTFFWFATGDGDAPGGHLEHLGGDDLVPFADAADVVQSFDHLAENGVDAVEVNTVLGVRDDEELAATGVFASVSHGEGSKGVTAGVTLSFTLDLPAWTSGTRLAVALLTAVGAADLDDEVLHDAVRVQAIVETVVDEFEEVFDGLWSVVGIEFNGECTALRRHYDAGQCFIAAHEFPRVQLRYDGLACGTVHWASVEIYDTAEIAA